MTDAFLNYYPIAGAIQFATALGATAAIFAVMFFGLFIRLLIIDGVIKKRADTARELAWEIVLDARLNREPDQHMKVWFRFYWLKRLRPWLRQCGFLLIIASFFRFGRWLTSLPPVKRLLRFFKRVQDLWNSWMVTIRPLYNFFRAFWEIVGKFLNYVSWGNFKRLSAFVRLIWPVLLGWVRRIAYLFIGASSLAFVITAIILILVVLGVIGLAGLLFWRQKKNILLRWKDFVVALVKHVVDDFVKPLQGRYWVEWLAITILINLFSANTTAAYLGWINKYYGMAFAAIIATALYFVISQVHRAYLRRKAHMAKRRKLPVRWWYREKRAQIRARKKRKTTVVKPQLVPRKRLCRASGRSMHFLFSDGPTVL